MLQLTERLRCLAGQVPEGAKLADIGTDHAYLPVYLLKTGRITRAIACDLREGPLARGRAVALRWGIASETIDFRCGDGLQALQAGEADCLVLAGMGGDTIIRCMGAVSWSWEAGLCYLLQPMSSIAELRSWLSKNGFCIEEEFLIREPDRRYLALRVRPGRMPPLSEAECWVGRQEKGQQAPERLAYLEETIARRARALAGMQASKTRDMSAEIASTTTLLADLQSMRKEWLSWQV